MNILKKSFDYCIIFLQFVFAGFFLLLIIGYNVQLEDQTFFERGMLSENVRGIQLSSSYLKSTKNEVVNLEIPQLDGEYALYKHISDEDTETVRGIYETSDIFHYSDYIESGRFFCDEDFEKQTATAVIGSNMLDYTYEEDEVRYYGYEGELYEVIGVFEETGEQLDNIVFLNLAFLLTSMDNYGLYYVDSLSARQSEMVIDTMVENAGEDYTTSFVEYECQTQEINLTNENMLICAMIGIILTLCVTVRFYVFQQSYYIGVLKMCGYTKKNLLILFLKPMMLIVFVAYCIIILLMNLLSSGDWFFFRPEHISTYHYVIAGFFMLFGSCMLVAGIIHQADTISIPQVLKEG